MSRFCSFVSFLIGSPFVGLGGAGRDDANDFLIGVFIKSVDDQEDRSRSYGSDGYPTFLIAGVFVSSRNGVGIIENENGSLKPHVMFANVLAVLVFVPCKSHGSRQKFSILIGTSYVNIFVRTSRAGTPGCAFLPGLLTFRDRSSGVEVFPLPLPSSFEFVLTLLSFQFLFSNFLFLISSF